MCVQLTRFVRREIIPSFLSQRLIAFSDRVNGDYGFSRQRERERKKKRGLPTAIKRLREEENEEASDAFDGAKR